MSTAIDEYLESLPSGMEETTRTFVALMRAHFPGCREEVKWGNAVLWSGDTELIGIAARKGFYSIYVPHNGLAKEFGPCLGKVDAGKCAIRFKKLEDVNLSALETLFVRIKEGLRE